MKDLLFKKKKKEKATDKELDPEVVIVNKGICNIVEDTLETNKN